MAITSRRHAELKRLAWWRAAQVVLASLESGYGVTLREWYGEEEGAVVEELLEKIVTQMERKGRG
jgi:hypothetical protein